MSKSCIRWQGCKIAKSAEHHSEEKRKSYDYVRQDLISNNEHFCPVADLGKYFEDKIVEYTDTIGQRPKLEEQTFIKKGKSVKREGWTPLREAVILIKEDTTMDDMIRLSEALFDNFKMRTLQIHIDRDEGHWSRPENEDGTLSDKEVWIPNLHAHLVYDNTYPQGTTGEITGKNKKGEISSMIKDLSCRSIKLTDVQLKQMQTIVAQVLVMERGTHSDKKNLDAITYKNKVEEEKAVALGKKVKELSVKDTDLTADIQQKENKIIELEDTISKKDDELIKKNTQIDELNDSLNEVKKQNAEVKKGLKENALEIIDSGILDIKEEGKSKEMRELIEADTQNENLSQNVKTVVDGMKDAAHAAIEKIEDMSAKESEIKHNIKSEAIDILDSNILDVNGEGISKNIKTLFENDVQNEHVIENFNLVACGLQETVETLNNVITESQEIVDGLETKVKDLSAKKNEINGDIKTQTLEIIDSGILDIKEEGRSKVIRSLIENDPNNDNLNQNFKAVVEGVKESAKTAIELSEIHSQIKQKIASQETILEQTNEKIKTMLETVGSSLADVLKDEIHIAVTNEMENTEKINPSKIETYSKIGSEIGMRPSEIMSDMIVAAKDRFTDNNFNYICKKFDFPINTPKENTLRMVSQVAKDYDDRKDYSTSNPLINSFDKVFTFKSIAIELKKNITNLADKATSDKDKEKKLVHVATLLNIDIEQAITKTIDSKMEEKESKIKDLDVNEEEMEAFNSALASNVSKYEETSSALNIADEELNNKKNELVTYRKTVDFLKSIPEVTKKMSPSQTTSTPSLNYPNIPFNEWRIESVRKQGSLFDKEVCFIVPITFKDKFKEELSICRNENNDTIKNHTQNAVENCKKEFYDHTKKAWDGITSDFAQTTVVKPIKKQLEEATKKIDFLEKLCDIYRKHPDVADNMTKEKENELFEKGKTIVKTIVEPFILLYDKITTTLSCDSSKNRAKEAFGENPTTEKDRELKKRMEETGEFPGDYKFDNNQGKFILELFKDIVKQTALDFSEKIGIRRGKGMGI